MGWFDVVTKPLGLVAFALALIFGMAGAKLKSRQERWFLPVAVTMAALAVIGGLLFAKKKGLESSSIESEKAATKALPQKNSTAHDKPAVLQVNQKTHGAGSPAIQGNYGNVTIKNK